MVPGGQTCGAMKVEGIFLTVGELDARDFGRLLRRVPLVARRRVNLAGFPLCSSAPEYPGLLN